jgi:MFS family permease
MHRRARRSAQPLGRMRTLTATFVVPVVVVCGLLLAAALGPNKQSEDLASLVVAAIFQYLFVLAFTGAVVVILRLFWQRWDFMRGWLSAAIGAALGCGVMIAFGIAYSSVPAFASQPIPLAGFARATLILGITGAVSGLVFWRIAHAEMRPNKSLERTRER